MNTCFSKLPGEIDGHTSRIFTCCFNPRSNHEFLSGGWDDVVHFWDLRQPHAIRHLSGVHVCGDGIDINTKGTEVSAPILLKAGKTEGFRF